MGLRGGLQSLLEIPKKAEPDQPGGRSCAEALSPYPAPRESPRGFHLFACILCRHYLPSPRQFSITGTDVKPHRGGADICLESKVQVGPAESTSVLARSQAQLQSILPISLHKLLFPLWFRQAILRLYSKAEFLCWKHHKQEMHLLCFCFFLIHSSEKH